jgi:hypothetical protein
MNTQKKPVEEIVGVLDRLGIYALPIGKRSPWTMRFTLQPWKRADGEPQKRPLVIQEKRVSDRRLGGLRSKFKPRDTLRVRVRLGKDRAELVKIVGKVTGGSDLALGAKKEPKKTWKHQDLGAFAFGYLGWVTTRSLPAFKAFRYSSRPSGKSSSKIKICFSDAEAPEDLPTPRAIAVAVKVIKNQESLAAKLKKSLFDDMNGRGSRSGMWWHGNIQSVIEYTADETGKRKPMPLKVPADLERLLGDPMIVICESVYGYDKPCAIISFSALFEREHGVGILTDGVRILGLGDSVDVSPFTAVVSVKVCSMGSERT